jgi:hypothetical protein
MTARSLSLAATVVAMVLAATAPAALASDRSTKEDAGWGCGAAVGLPEGHCISPGTVARWERVVARGTTFQLLVFDEVGGFRTAEIATFAASADRRPCRHDTDDRNTDGTYWEFVPGLYVCHHRPG